MRLPTIPRARVLRVHACGLCFAGSPRLSVADITLGHADDGSAVVTLVIEATNDGDESLPLMSAAYEVEINGVSAYRGEWDAQATVPVGGTVRFELPAPVDASLVAPGLRASYSVRGVVEYVPPGALGEALFDAKFRRGSASFAETGDLVVAGAKDES